MRRPLHLAAMNSPRLLVFLLLVAFAAFLFVSSDNKLGAQPETKTRFLSLQDKTKPIRGSQPPIEASATGLLIKPQFRISETSTLAGNRNAGSAEAAYNPDDNEYLVVWESDGLTEVKGVNDIYGQRLSGDTNERIGIGFRISTLTDGDKHHGSNRPKVVYNRTAGEYLVVWHGSGLFDSPDKFFEVYGQRLNRTGQKIGTNFRISYATDLGKVSTSFVRSSSRPDLAWNSTNNEYMVIWTGMGEPEDVVKMEIYGQRVNPSGELLGKALRISHTTDQGVNFQSAAPAIAFNSRDNQYLVVWSGGFKNESQVEIWGKGLSGTGTAAGPTNEFRISNVSDVGTNRRASAPDVVYNDTNNEYLVVFQANAVRGAGSENVNEIFGQRLDAATFVKTGANDFRISNVVGPDNSSSRPAVSFNTVAKEYLVIWRARRDAAYEISGQRVSAAGIETDGDFQISNVAAVGKDRTVNNASLVHNPRNGHYLVVWQGNVLANDAKITEIFGQQLALSRSPRR